mgnify:CR=1 FL=1|jgi:hypothetical protein|tara:strand:- start:54194 stop:54736 length:543 start_codon:yes stop_codon:yes gene_type:complete
MRARFVIIGALATLSLQACAVSRDPGGASTGERARDAAIQPLSDVGIVQPKVEDAIQRILDDPYRLPEPASCARLGAEITQMNEVLGPDFDTVTDDPSLTEKRRNAALGLAGKFGAGMLIPFRGVVREVTGSAGRERAYRAAILAGVARRSYLKGRAIERGCTLPPPVDYEDLNEESNED